MKSNRSPGGSSFRHKQPHNSINISTNSSKGLDRGNINTVTPLSGILTKNQIESMNTIQSKLINMQRGAGIQHIPVKRKQKTVNQSLDISFVNVRNNEQSQGTI